MAAIHPALLWVSSLISFAVIILYIRLIVFHGKKSDRDFFRFIKWSFLLIAVAYFLLDLLVMTRISVEVEKMLDWFPLILLAVWHSIEVFLFQTHFFDNGYEDYFFNGEVDWRDYPNSTIVLIVAVTLAVLAAVTSVSLIVRTLSKRRADRNWLSSHAANAGNTHIFLQSGDASTNLAQDIKSKDPAALTVLVGFPNPDSNSLELSLWEKIKKFISPSPAPSSSFDMIVYSKIALDSVTETNDFYLEIGMKNLKPYLENNGCKVYMLGTDENKNFKIARILDNAGCKAHIYCRASREGANRMYEEAFSNSDSRNFSIVDSSYLAVRTLKSRTEMLPVNFVEKGLDDCGRKEGWVASEFKSLVIGFGEIGRECMKFLYEHGAFVGKDFKKSPFSCTVIDAQADGLEMVFANSFPGMTEDKGVHFKQMEAGSSDFWSMFRKDLDSLNYIAVCTGNDKLNLRLAVDILEYAIRSGKDLSKNFVIAVAMKNPSDLDRKVIDYYNNIPLSCACLKPFAAEEEIWNYDNITNASINENAKRYFTAYKSASGIPQNESEKMWDEREDEIKQTADYRLHLKKTRQKQQDYANCFHIPTKLALVGDEIIEKMQDIANDIPSEYVKTHYNGTDKHIDKALRYLAVGEHIRWEASHIALGYCPGDKTDELLKTHAYIQDYDELTPEIQHYDYLVVKTTFEL